MYGDPSLREEKTTRMHTGERTPEAVSSQLLDKCPDWGDDYKHEQQRGTTGAGRDMSEGQDQPRPSGLTPCS